MLISLRADQERAVSAVMAKRRGIIHFPTGSGKTVLAAAIVDRVPGDWLLLFHRRHLRDQTKEEFTCFGIDSVKSFTSLTSERGRVTVATWQGLRRRLLRGDKRALPLLMVKGLIVDECHTSASPEFAALLELFENAEYRIGLSATPLLREDGLSKATRDFFGPVLNRIDAPELVEKGVLAKPLIRFVRGPEIGRAHV